MCRTNPWPSHPQIAGEPSTSWMIGDTIPSSWHCTSFQSSLPPFEGGSIASKPLPWHYIPMSLKLPPPPSVGPRHTYAPRDRFTPPSWHERWGNISEEKGYNPPDQNHDMTFTPSLLFLGFFFRSPCLLRCRQMYNRFSCFYFPSWALPSWTIDKETE